MSQNVPNSVDDDFMLTALRQDEYTAKAPGVFREENLHQSYHNTENDTKIHKDGVRHFPSSVPELIFSVVDQGSLDRNGLPLVNDENAFCVAPEVVHLSRFARSYKMYPDTDCLKRVDLCLYNSKVAAELQCGSLARYVAQHASFVTLVFEIACVFLSTSSFAAAAAAAASTFMSH